MKSQIEAIYGIHPLKVQYSYFRSFDLSNREKPIKDGARDKMILFIKHDFERGGLFYLIEALRLIDDKSIRLKIVGIPEKQIKKLKKSLSEIPYEMVSKQGREEIFKDYMNASLFCVPSQSEALGLANMEAMQLGIPVVAFDIPVMRELNSNRNIMLLSKYQDVKDLAQCISTTLERDKEVEDRIKRAALFIEEEISKEQFYAKLNRFFAN